MTITDQPTPLEFVNPHLFIDGQWRRSSRGAEFDVENPATGDIIATVADGTVEDGLAALEAAHRSQAGWESTPPFERANLLFRVHEALIASKDLLAEIIAQEMGKPMAQAIGEVLHAADYFRWFAHECERINGRIFQPGSDGTDYWVTQRAVGPVLLVTPWNFPIAMGARKLAPALAAGCTAVIKPAALTPLTSLAFVKIVQSAGLPDGVVNVVTTSRVGPLVSALMEDPRLRKISFTGSTEVGQNLIRQSATGVLRTSMELGGNAPFVVFADADVDAAVQGALLAKLRNAGQACTAANRFIVHDSVENEFTEKLVTLFEQQVLGAGIDPLTDVGPLVSRRARDTVDQLVASAVAGGARLITGGTPVGEYGHFFAPTVLTKVDQANPIWRTEIFGPVAAISTFATEDQAITMANDTDLGLSGYAFTKNPELAVRLSRVLEVGMLGVNKGLVTHHAAPFGGLKKSGFGREGGIEGIEEYQETVFAAFAR